MPLTLSDESRYRILRLIEHNPAISQREIARELGISLGKVNFCLQALIDKGILLDLLGRTTRVRVPLDVLIPLPATQKNIPSPLMGERKNRYPLPLDGGGLGWGWRGGEVEVATPTMRAARAVLAGR